MSCVNQEPLKTKGESLGNPANLTCNKENRNCQKSLGSKLCDVMSEHNRQIINRFLNLHICVCVFVVNHFK